MTKTGSYIVKGCYYHDAPAAMAAGALKIGAAIVLRCDGSNRLYPDAVSVHLAATDQKLGHISRHHCARVGALIRAKKFRAARVAKAVNTNPMSLEIRVEWSESEAPARQTATPAPAAQVCEDLIGATAKSLPDKPGVYKLTCKASGRIYVGSSASVRNRAQRHARELRACEHANKALQTDFRDYGGDRFEFSLVCEALDARQAESLEARCIRDGIKGGKTLFYNATNDGKGIKGAENAIARTQRSTPVDRAALPELIETKPTRADRAPHGVEAPGSRLAPSVDAPNPPAKKPIAGAPLTANQKLALAALLAAVIGVLLFAL